MHYAKWQKLDSKDCILYDSIHLTLKKSKATVTEKRSLFATGWVWAGSWGSLMTEEREGTFERWKCSIYWLWHCLSKFVELHIQKGEFYCVNFIPINLTFKNVKKKKKLWLIHFDVWQKTKFCKAIVLQLKNKLKKTTRGILNQIVDVSTF